MVLLMPDDSQKRVREILARDFNASEVKKAVRNGGIIIKEGDPGRGAAGCYIPMQETSSLKTPVIILGKNWDEETLVHEFTHHLRHVDQTRGGLTRTPLKLNAGGERVSSRAYDTREYNSAVNLEEAATVAESLVRIQAPSKGANGYYTATKIHGDTPMERYTHDRNTLVTDKPLRGRKAEKQVTGRFDDTSISHLGYYRPGSNAANYYKERKARGTLPVPVKPLKKKKADATKGTVSGPIGATATKSPNRRIVRGKR